MLVIPDSIISLLTIQFMVPLAGSKIYESELAFFWFSEDGVLCSVDKNIPRSLKRQEENYLLIRQITGNKKVCLLSDATLARRMDEETRAYVSAQMPHLFHAMAVLSKTPAGQTLTNVFLILNNPGIPVQFFRTETEAKQWLKQFAGQRYLEKNN